jgi:hypothetical protein
MAKAIQIGIHSNLLGVSIDVLALLIIMRPWSGEVLYRVDMELLYLIIKFWLCKLIR